MIPNFQTRTCNDSNLPIDIGCLKTLGVIEIATIGTHRIVKMVHFGKVRFAYIALSRRFQFQLFLIGKVIQCQ